MLTAIIAAGIDRGELNIADPATAADDLSGLWFGFVNLEIKLGAREPLTSAEIDARVSRGLQLFMALYRKPDAEQS
jgi:TetR/AcrR family transcriptional repressor of mexJK operon